MSILKTPIPAQKNQRYVYGQLHGASRGLALANIIDACNHPVILVTPDTLTATRLEYELQFFGSGNDIFHFPDWETLPYDHFSPHQDITSERLAALAALPQLKTGVIITPISTLMQRLPPRSFFAGNTLVLSVGDQYDLAKAKLHLAEAGYRAVEQVREHGEFAQRGSILDLFPMGSETPYRIDLLDDEIDSIRTFSTETQRTLEKISTIRLLPAQEFPVTDEAIDLFRQQWRQQFSGNPLQCPIYEDISEGIASPGIEYYLPLFFTETATLFDYLPNNTLFVQVGNNHTQSEVFWKEITERYEQRSNDITRPLLTPEQLYIDTGALFSQFKNYAQIKIDPESTDSGSEAFVFATEKTQDFPIDHKALQPLSALQNWLGTQEGRILFCAETTGRREVLTALLYGAKIQPKIYDNWHSFLEDDTAIGLTVAPLEEGLVLTNPKLCIIAESQLYGKRVMQSRRRKVSVQDPDAIVRDLTELQMGSPIVHIEHGVGRYLGLQTLTVNDQIAEFLCLEYADAAKLYVPVASLHLINRYTGAEADSAPIHRLGTEQWQKAKRKAAEQIRDVAVELLDLYAKRAARPGLSCGSLDTDYARFAAAFPFEETPDQQAAIDRVIEDMQAEKPMDRLVCGDVGFGKTEVAMRAAYVAVANNKQAAILVPTTLLAQQHYQNFLDRFADTPVKIASLSRFTSSKDQGKQLDLLAEGKVDIVIGTHKLLQEDVRFKNLGLVIIDEEHRFGVKQKERLKSLRTEVDILTLTATPIPRTLNMAFAGMRDLSIIATPPLRRLSVKTFLHEYSDSIIKEAILREIMRGGQVYFLHNDVATINKTAADLMKQIPEARVGVAHGQMRERELEQVMSDFYHRRFTVLVCTTIVESGIDVPSANTIIIDRADKLGLAQLHQLRGRVGRSHHQAYAYLLTPPEKKITADAEKRLEAIANLEDLGVGFTLATHDLEIRGAGELLGEGQSGNMHAIGFALYMDLLSRAVDALKAGTEPNLIDLTPKATEIDLQISALIPEHYLPDVQLRLQFYKRIACTQTEAELDEIQVEMIDRFGLLNDPLRLLFKVSLLRQRADSLGITKIEANNKGGKIEFADKPKIDPVKMIQAIQARETPFRFDGPTRLRFTLDQHEPADRPARIHELLDRFA